MKKGKAHCKDDIGARFYKKTCFEMMPFKNVLFKDVLNSGNFPEIWTECLIIPLNNSEQVMTPSNYRGIELLNTMYKSFSSYSN